MVMKAHGGSLIPRPLILIRRMRQRVLLHPCYFNLRLCITSTEGRFSRVSVEVTQRNTSVVSLTILAATDEDTFGSLMIYAKLNNSAIRVTPSSCPARDAEHQVGLALPLQRLLIRYTRQHTHFLPSLTVSRANKV